MGRRGGATHYGILNYITKTEAVILSTRKSCRTWLYQHNIIGGAYLPEWTSTTQLIDFSYYFQAILNEEVGGMNQKSTAMKKLQY